MRLLLAQAMVLAVGVGTTAMIAAVVGPPLFREHLRQAGVPPGSMEEVHAEEAYTYATALSVGGALAVSVLAALAVSWYVSARLQRSVTEVAEAATAVADGRFDIRVSPPGLGDEFEALALAFNRMAERLAAIDATRRRMFGDLAHEIRTPVAVLEAYTEALEDGVRELTPETATMLRDQSKRLVRFSDDLAALAQAEEGPASMARTLVDVAQLIDSASGAVRNRFMGKGVDLALDVAADLPPLWGDEQRLGQVLVNLLDNALRHTPSGGRVTVRAQSDQSDVSLTVVDDGEGMAGQHLSRVFERFYRADAARDREHGGAGIGLAIVKALVEAHGGRITAGSAGVGKGATFTVLLPVRATAAVPASLRSPSVGKP